MSVIFIVVPLAALIVLAAVIAFVASARRGQFDDLDTPPVRMLNDDCGAVGSADHARVQLKTEKLTTADSKLFQGSPITDQPGSIEPSEARSSIAGSDISRGSASE